METRHPAIWQSWRPFQSIGRLTAKTAMGDAVAGLTLAAIAVPEQMATARLGGFAPQLGLLAFVAASVGFAIFGSNRRLSAGADSTITPIFAGGLAAIAGAGSMGYGPSAALLAVMVGLLLVLAGLFKLGWMADLLSKPVVTGFLAGIALHIVLSQAPALLGLPGGHGNVYVRLASLWSQRQVIQATPLALGLGVFGLIVLLDWLNPRIPGALIAVAVAMALTLGLKLQDHGVTVLGPISGSLIPTRPAPLLLDGMLPLAGLSVTIALVIMVQTAATARAFPPQDGEPDINGDYLGLGAAGVLAGLAGAFPVNASPPRTAAAAQAGARSQLCSLSAAGLTAILALFGTDILALVPQAALSGVLLFVAQRIFRVRVFASLLAHTRAEFALAALTAILIVLLPIETGVVIGVFLSLAHGVFTITRTHLIEFEHLPGGTIWWPATTSRQGQPQPGVLVMGFQAPLSFLNAHEFRRGVQMAIAADPSTRLFVLEAGSVVELDYTAAEVLSGVIAWVRAQGADFAVARLESVRAQAAFQRFGVSDQLGESHIFRSVDEAITALSHAEKSAIPLPTDSNGRLAPSRKAATGGRKPSPPQ